MALLEIIHAPDPRLKKKAQPVGTVSDATRRKLADMLETMYAEEGIGLAGPQVGILERLVVVDLAREGEDPQPMKMVNPEVIAVSAAKAVFNEGCLSLPDQFAEVSRPETITLRWLDEHGTAHQQEMTGLMATCIQHEIDHLDGTLFVDHITPLRRQIILRKLTKWKRDRAKAKAA